MLDFENYPIIPAVRTDADLDCALSSDVEAIFLIASDIMTVADVAKRTHEHGKLLFVHMDFTEGLSKDASGVHYLAAMGIDGVISTRSGVIAAAKKLGVTCIQRFFMVDSRSVDTALDSIRHLSPDMIEIMPAIAYKSISHIRNHTRIPIIAGGLIDSKDEIFSALGAGATMVSTGRHELWSV